MDPAPHFVHKAKVKTFIKIIHYTDTDFKMFLF